VSRVRSGACRAGAGRLLASVASGLTPHGLRHGHQTWLDELGIRYVLQSERMGHEVPSMRGVYSHVTPGMRADLVAGLQELWEASLNERARISRRSPVRVVDALLAGFRDPANKIGSHSAPKIGHLNARRPGLSSLLSLPGSARSARWPAPTGSPGPGSTRCWPATRRKARRRSTAVPPAEDLTFGGRRYHGGSDRPAAQGPVRAGPGRRTAHHRLASAPPSSADRVGGDDQPVPDPGRADYPRAEEAAQVACLRFAAELPNECWQPASPTGG
jgi:hypothetical protein